MKADAYLAAAEALPLVDFATITAGRGLVVVAPHPDDESLGCGGLIAEACLRGAPVVLIILTDGVGSHRRSACYPPARLKALREEETVAAAAALGLDKSRIRFLGLPDAALPTEGPHADRARDAIVEAALSCDAGVVCVTWRHDPHCDHRAAALLVDAALAVHGAMKVLAYPVWGWALPAGTTVGEPPKGVRLDISQHLARKTAAIAAHRSQTTDLIDDDPTGFRLAPSMIEHFLRPFEIFLEDVP